MRQLVMDAECEILGHDLRFDNVQTYEGRNGRIMGPGGPWPTGQMPHIYCARCGHVWIVSSKDGRNYNQAERRFRERLIPTDPQALEPTP